MAERDVGKRNGGRAATGRKRFRPSALQAVAAVLLAALTAAADDAVLQRGKRVYVKSCLECHGNAGRGDGPKSKQLGFRPRDFTLGAFKCRCTASGELPSDEDLFRTVTQGLSGTPMKSFEKELPREDREAVIQYVKTFSPRWSGARPPRCLDFPAPVPSTDQAVAEGRQIYKLLGCFKCHGKEGKGDGPAAAALKDDWGNSIRAYNFTVGNRFKCGAGERDVYRTLHTGLNGSPMPSFTDAFLFPRELGADLSGYQGAYTGAEIQEFADYLKRQPDSAALNALQPNARQDLIEKRTWALVHFLRSLVSSAR